MTEQESSLNYKIEEVSESKRLINIIVDSSNIKQLYLNVQQDLASNPELEMEQVVSQKMEKIISESYQEVVVKEGLDVLGSPRMDIVQFGMETPLEFNAEVQLFPDVKLDSYIPIKIKIEVPEDILEIDRQSLIQQALMDTIVEQAEMNVPEDLVKQEQLSMWHQTESDKFHHLPAKIREMSMENWLKDAELRTRAEERLKSSLILAWIARKEDLSVTQEDLEENVIQLATENGLNPEALWQEYQQNPDAMDLLMDKIWLIKTMMWLQNQAEVEEIILPSSNKEDADKKEAEVGE